MEPKTNFREQLLAAEPITSAYREKYQKELKNMLEKKLSKTRIVGLVIVLMFCFIETIRGGWELAAHWTQHNWTMVLVRFGGLIFLAGWAILIISSLKKGNWNQKSNPKWAAMLTLGFLILLAVSSMNLSEYTDPIKGLRMLAFTIIFIGLFMPAIIQNWIHQAQLKTEERLLELQCQVAELSERLGGAARQKP